MVRGLLMGAVLAAVAAGGCSKPAVDPLQLDGNRLTVHNSTSDDWTAVEIWLNMHYRVTVPSIAAGSRFQVSLDSFVAGYGQRFDFNKMQISDLRLTAKQRDGKTFGLTKEFEAGGLAGALGGKR